MKKDVKEIAAKSEKELIETLKTKRSDLYSLILDNKQNKLKNTRSIYNTRKEIARIMTLIREKQLNSLNSEEGPADAKALAGKATK